MLELVDSVLPLVASGTLFSSALDIGDLEVTDSLIGLRVLGRNEPLLTASGFSIAGLLSNAVIGLDVGFDGLAALLAAWDLALSGNLTGDDGLEEAVVRAVPPVPNFTPEFQAGLDGLVTFEFHAGLVGLAVPVVFIGAERVDTTTLDGNPGRISDDFVVEDGFEPAVLYGLAGLVPPSLMGDVERCVDIVTMRQTCYTRSQKVGGFYDYSQGVLC